MSMPPVRWLPTPALSSALGLVSALSLLAITLGRPDLLVIALPVGVGAVLGLLTRAYQLPTVSVRPQTTTLLEGESTRLLWQFDSAEPIELVRVRTTLQGGVSQPDGSGHLVTTLSGSEPTSVAGTLMSTRWGHGRVTDLAVTAYTAHGLLRADVRLPSTAAVRVLPLREGFTATDAVPRATGVVGLHRSRRVGEGIDLAGVRPFSAGDRLRRINWPVSTRTGQLHVTSTYSDRDTEVVLVLDTTVEVGHSSGTDQAVSTIDQAVRAAGSIAEHYLRNGDRVGLLDLSRPGRPIRSRAGRAQLNRVIDILLDVRPVAVLDGALRRSLARISPGALVIVLSPLLSADVAEAVAELARTGRNLIVVDTLPDRVELPEHGDWTGLAWQLQMLHRDNLSATLASHGVPVVRWLGTGSLDAVLLGLSRMAAAPRALR